MSLHVTFSLVTICTEWALDRTNGRAYAIVSRPSVCRL